AFDCVMDAAMISRVSLRMYARLVVKGCALIPKARYAKKARPHGLNSAPPSAPPWVRSLVRLPAAEKAQRLAQFWALEVAPAPCMLKGRRISNWDEELRSQFVPERQRIRRDNHQLERRISLGTSTAS